MNSAYLALIWILMNGIWPVGLCCNYSPLSTLHWRMWWWSQCCISYFLPRQHVGGASSALLSMYFASNSATKGRYNRYSEDIALDLVFFSAFEDLLLHTSGTMETNRIRKLYEPSPVPTLYVGRTADLLGRVPLFPCFLHGNATSTIPNKYAARRKQAFKFGCADSASQGLRRGSHVY